MVCIFALPTRQGSTIDGWMKRYRTAVITAFAAPLILVLTGCERRVVTSDYFPMRDGNRWAYRFLDAGMLERLGKGEHIKTASTEPDDTKATGAPGERKAEVMDVDASTQASRETSVPKPSSGDPTTARRIVLSLKERRDDLTYRAELAGTEQVWSKKDGYVGFQNARGRHYWLILPPHTGYRWIVTGANGENLYYEIEGHEELTTPAGIFRHCAVVRQETRDRRISFRYWFCDGVGLVRRSKYYLKEEVFRQELVEFKIRPSTDSGRRAEQREIERALKGKRRGQEFLRPSKPRKGGLEVSTP